MTPAFDPTSLIIAGAVFAFGLLLLIIGLRGRRIGDEPRCRKCGYDLTGAASDQCSECGATINQQGIVHGTRRRRPVMIVVALLALAAAGTFGGLDGYRRLQAIDKYRYYPFSWLIDGGHAGDLAALKELDRRLRTDKLSSKQLQRIIADALAEQAVGPSISPLVTQQWVNMLEYVSQNDGLSDSQLQQYFSQSRRYTLVARPQVRVGEPVTIEARYRSFGPMPPQSQRDPQGRPIAFDLTNIRLLNAPLAEAIRPISPRTPTEYGSLTYDGPGPVGSAGSCSPTVHLTTPVASDFVGPPGFSPPPGTHQVVCDLVERIFDIDVGIPIEDGATPIFTRTVPLIADLEVLPSYAPDTVQLVDDPELAAQIRSAIDVDAWRSTIGDIVILAGPKLPMNVAFDIHAQAGAESWHLGELVAKAGSVWGTGFNASPIPRKITTVDIVLRSSPDAARRTIDIFKIWDGELVFTNIPVRRR